MTSCWNGSKLVGRFRVGPCVRGRQHQSSLTRRPPFNATFLLGNSSTGPKRATRSVRRLPASRCHFSRPVRKRWNDFGRVTSQIGRKLANRCIAALGNRQHWRLSCSRAPRIYSSRCRSRSLDDIPNSFANCRVALTTWPARLWSRRLSFTLCWGRTLVRSSAWQMPLPTTHGDTVPSCSRSHAQRSSNCLQVTVSRCSHSCRV